MKQDKLYSVTLDGDALIMGYVKAETMGDAIAYVEGEYPNYKLIEISETSRIIL